MTRKSEHPLVPLIVVILSFLAGMATSYRSPPPETPAYVESTYAGVTEVTYLALPDGHSPTH